MLPGKTRISIRLNFLWGNYPCVHQVVRSVIFHGIDFPRNLVEYEAGTDPYQEGMVLYGFDEVGMFEFNCPQHAFVNGTLAELVLDRSKPAKIVKVQ